MKINYLFLVSVSIFLIAFSACKTHKSIQNVTDAKEITQPFSSKKYKTDQDYFRAKQVGKSPDEATSKKIALDNAKAELAANVQSLFEKVTSQFTNQRTVANVSDFENKFTIQTYEVVNQKLAGVSIIGEKTFEETDGSYSSWIAVEMSKTTLLDGINNKISKDASLKLDYDQKKFEEIFNREMQKLENEK